MDSAAAERVLAGTDLIGLAVTEGPGDVLVVNGINVRDVLGQWRAARSVVDLTGRWPVAVTVAFGGSLEAEVAVPDPGELDELQHLAEVGDPWQDDLADWPVERSELASRARTPAGLELAAEAEQALPMPTTEPVLDRWLYERILADPQQRARELARVQGYATVDYWFSPETADLVLLPTTSFWLVPAWLSYFGALGEDYWRVAAALWQWRERGAELVASWGTMMQLTGARPAKDGDDAWQLAGQLKRIGGSLQMDRWQLALALAAGDAWFLHDRP